MMANDPAPQSDAARAAQANSGGPDGGGRVDQWGGRPVPLQRAVGVRPQTRGPEAAAAMSIPRRRPRGGPDALLAALRGRAGAERRAAVLAPLPARSQRLVVMSAAGGVGRSVVVAGIALACARHRRWPLVAVDAAEPGFNALSARFGVGGGPTILDVVPLLDRVKAGDQLGRYTRQVHTERISRDRTGRDRTSRDRTGGDRTSRDRTSRDRTGRDRGHRADGAPDGSGGADGERVGGVHLLAAPGPRRMPLEPATMSAVLARLAALYPTVVVDCPPGISGGYQQAALAGATAVVLVARSRDDDLRRTAVMAGVLAEVLPARVPVVGVVVAARPGGWNRAAAAAEPVLGARCAAVIRLSWDVALAAGAPVTEVGPAVAAALEEVAAITIAAHPAPSQPALARAPAAPRGRGRRR
jgi:MinD-like ATPase involved in chromosome partitioning or flagellar assembly